MRKELWGQRDVPYGGTGPGEDSGSGGGGYSDPYDPNRREPGDHGRGDTPPPPPPEAPAQLGEAQPRDFGNGFTNLQAYLYANPYGGGANTAAPTAGYSQGMSAYDSGIAGAYGLTPATVAPPPSAAPPVPAGITDAVGSVGTSVPPPAQPPQDTGHPLFGSQDTGQRLRRYLGY